MKRRLIPPSALLLTAICGAGALHAQFGPKVKRVLLISIDGMHALDLAKYVNDKPASALGQLTTGGVNYTNAYTTRPSDSIPASAGIFTGGSPAVTGLYYDDAWSRSLSPAGSACATVGVIIDLKEGWDVNPHALDGGGGIDPTKVPLDPAKGCTPVMPHDLLRVNTIFEVIRAAGGRTAFSEKRPAYEFLNGPSGTGVQDLYAPEIAFDNPKANDTLKDVDKTIAFDKLRVDSIIHEIDGKDHSGVIDAPVPTLFGMNFQAVNAAKKVSPTSGYADSLSAPDAYLVKALNSVDSAIGSMVSELKLRGLFNSTIIIVTAKHAEAPLDPNHRTIVPTTTIPGILAAAGTPIAKPVTQKTAALIWLKDQKQTATAVAALSIPANQTAAGVSHILSDGSLRLLFPDPLTDPMVPDIIVVTNTGVNFEPAGSTTFAEHGGFGENETHVPLVVSFPGWTASTQRQPVTTTQIAPTVLALLGMNPMSLKAVQKEGTLPLTEVVTQFLTHLF